MKSTVVSRISVTASAVCAIGLLGVPMAANAQLQDDNQTSVVVHYDRAALITPSERSSLERKIRRAADHVCGAPSARDLREYQIVQDCRAASLARAHAEVIRQQLAYDKVALVGAAQR